MTPADIKKLLTEELIKWGEIKNEESLYAIEKRLNERYKELGINRKSPREIRKEWKKILALNDDRTPGGGSNTQEGQAH